MKSDKSDEMFAPQTLINREVWGKIQAALFTFSRFCDIIKAVRKLIDKIEFDEVIRP